MAPDADAPIHCGSLKAYRFIANEYLSIAALYSQRGMISGFTITMVVKTTLFQHAGNSPLSCLRWIPVLAVFFRKLGPIAEPIRRKEVQPFASWS